MLVYVVSKHFAFQYISKVGSSRWSVNVLLSVDDLGNGCTFSGSVNLTLLKMKNKEQKNELFLIRKFG